MSFQQKTVNCGTCIKNEAVTKAVMHTATTTKATQLMSAIQAPLKYIRLTLKTPGPLTATVTTTTTATAKPR